MKGGGKLPFAVDVTIKEYKPPRRLWHIPNTPPGTCPGCGSKIEGQSSISAAGHDWHVECFRCSLCRNPMPADQFVTRADLIFHHDCQLQCYNDRCAKCTELVDTKDGCQLLNRVYHRSCLSCERCGKKQSTGAKILSLYNMPYCQSCYEELIKTFPRCVTCQRPVLPSEDSKSFFYQGQKYFFHNPDCAKCAHCSKIPKVDELIVHKNKLCCKNCYKEASKKICAQCNEPIFNQASKMENIYWHAEHFQCSICHANIQPTSCVFNFGILKCKPCATEDRPICQGCGRPIQDSPVTALRAQWHQQCLICQFCERNVIGKKFFNVSGLPCCNECFEQQKKEGNIDKKGQLKKKSSKSHKHKH